MKICSICKIEMPLKSFSIQSTGKLGRRADCNECRKRFNRSEHGLVKQILQMQKAKSKKRNHPQPAYTEAQLFDWFWKQPNAQNLYTAWVLSNYQHDLRPSIDRLDDYKPYQFSNIQLTTVKNNVERYYTDALAGINTKTARAVDQYTLENVFVKRHHSLKAAAKEMNGDVSAIMKVAEGTNIIRREKDGSIRTYIPSKAYGFIWKNP